MTRTWSALLLLCLCACERPPESYSPPEQRHPVDGSNPNLAGTMIEMDDPGADDHIVKDMHEAGDSPWRWTGQEPTFKLFVYKPGDVKLSADFTLWDVGFKQTGPLELTFLVNGKTLDSVRYTTPGSKHFEKMAPPGWVSAGAESTIAIRIDKLYADPDDGAKFGIILVRIGFVQ